MESGPLLLNPDALAGPTLGATESGLAVIRDIYYLKLLAVEVVCQLALDTVSQCPKDSLLYSQLVKQVQEELNHLNHCRILLSERDAFGTRPGYVRHYTRVMRSYAHRRHRTLSLAIAVLFCIAVEKSAMEQMSRISTADPQISELLKQLGTDEEDHYKLVAGVAAPVAASRASRMERIRAYALMLRITAITLREWWPQRAADYQELGLRVDIFLEEMLEGASRAFRPLGLFFPQRTLLRLARVAMRIS